MRFLGTITALIGAVLLALAPTTANADDLIPDAPSVVEEMPVPEEVPTTESAPAEEPPAAAEESEPVDNGTADAEPNPSLVAPVTEEIVVEPASSPDTTSSDAPSGTPTASIELTATASAPTEPTADFTSPTTITVGTGSVTGTYGYVCTASATEAILRMQLISRTTFEVTNHDATQACDAGIFTHTFTGLALGQYEILAGDVYNDSLAGDNFFRVQRENVATVIEPGVPEPIVITEDPFAGVTPDDQPGTVNDGFNGLDKVTEGYSFSDAYVNPNDPTQLCVDATADEGYVFSGEFATTLCATFTDISDPNLIVITDDPFGSIVPIDKPGTDEDGFDGLKDSNEYTYSEPFTKTGDTPFTGGIETCITAVASEGYVFSNGNPEYCHTFQVDAAEAPTLDEPIVDGQDVTFAWNGGAFLSSSTLVVKNEAGDVVATVDVLGKTSVTLTLEPGSYTAQIESFNHATESDSNIVGFTVEPIDTGNGGGNPGNGNGNGNGEGNQGNGKGNGGTVDGNKPGKGHIPPPKSVVYAAYADDNTGLAQTNRENDLREVAPWVIIIAIAAIGIGGSLYFKSRDRRETTK